MLDKLNDWLVDTFGDVEIDDEAATQYEQIVSEIKSLCNMTDMDWSLISAKWAQATRRIYFTLGVVIGLLIAVIENQIVR